MMPELGNDRLRARFFWCWLLFSALLSGSHSLVAEPTPAKAAEEDSLPTVLLIGKQPDHPFGSHMYLHTSEMLSKCLARNGKLRTIVSSGIPADLKEIKGLRAMVVYTDPGAEFLLGGEQRKDVLEVLGRGVGLVTLHWASSIRKEHLEALGPAWLEVMGGTWVSNVGIQTGDSPLKQLLPEHPICHGWQEYDLHDEFYLNPTITAGATPLLQVTAKQQPVIVGWSFERTGGGRSFGTTLGHFYSNFQREPFRRMVVNAILWAAKIDVPEQGADVALSEAELALPEKKEAGG